MRFLIVLMLIAACAAAQPVDPNPDGMSIYFDTEGTAYCLELDDWEPTAGAGPTITAYLLVTRPDTVFPTIQAWEAHIEIVTNSYTPPSASPWQLTPGSANYTNIPGDYVVSPGHGYQPIICEAVLIAQVDLSWSGWEGHAEATFILEGVEGSLSFPDGPGYAAEAGFPSPCQSLFGEWGEVAWINGDCLSMGNDDLTWGAVKRLY